ncbi:hypothetical protein V8E55_011726, partial [Tylopilus felleus]
VTCGICHLATDRPFLIRECGHCFCYGCLRTWFHHCLAQQLSYHDVPARLRSPPYTSADINELFADSHIFILIY